MSDLTAVQPEILEDLMNIRGAALLRLRKHHGLKAEEVKSAKACAVGINQSKIMSSQQLLCIKSLPGYE